MMQEVYGTQRRVKIEGEILVQTFNHCPETKDEVIMNKIRALMSPACFEKFGITVVERVENVRLLMDGNMQDSLRKAIEGRPGVPVGERIEKPAQQVEQAEPANS